MQVHTKNTAVEEGRACRVQVGVDRADAACSPRTAAPELQPSCEGAFQWAVHVCRRGVPMPTSGSGCTCAVSCAGVPGFTPKGQDSLHLGTSCSLKSLESTTSCYLLRGWAEWEKHSIITSRQQEPETNSGFFCVSCQNTFLWAE